MKWKITRVNIEWFQVNKLVEVIQFEGMEWVWVWASLQFCNDSPLLKIEKWNKFFSIFRCSTIWSYNFPTNLIGFFEKIMKLMK